MIENPEEEKCHIEQLVLVCHIKTIETLDWNGPAMRRSNMVTFIYTNQVDIH